MPAPLDVPNGSRKNEKKMFANHAKYFAENENKYL